MFVDRSFIHVVVSDEVSEDSGLSGGAIAGIVIGGLVFVGLVSALGIHLDKKKKQKLRQSPVSPQLSSNLGPLSLQFEKRKAGGNRGEKRRKAGETEPGHRLAHSIIVTSVYECGYVKIKDIIFYVHQILFMVGRAQIHGVVSWVHTTSNS